MEHDDRLSPGMQQFIESLGVYFEHLEMPRIAGRILGLLLVADRPLTLDDMAASLRVSRGSASTNIRLAVQAGVAELVGFPGDRHDYYRLADDAWEHNIRRGIKLTTMLRRIVEEGLAALEPDDCAARARLADLHDFCDFSLGELAAMLARWREHHQARAATRTRPAPPFDPGRGASAR
ncbi:MAG TPA: transcriptional regulator [Chloroflexota bacterium]|nr:transcriptional regulator [Chloroflexota bacterium]